MIRRFLDAQEDAYPTALSEIRAGRKQTHWVWYIFPQLKQLGKSSYAICYGIRDLDEAREYLAHPVLRARLIEISEALLALPSNDPDEVMGWHIDALKLRSCMTLFEAADPDCPVFPRVLEKFFRGERDSRTLKYLNEGSAPD